MISFGDKFVPTGLKPEITCIFSILEGESTRQGLHFIITSGIDRAHGYKSRHHSGLAIDLTWFDYKLPLAKDIGYLLARRLGPCYDVVVEDNHIHIEYDPKYKSIN